MTGQVEAALERLDQHIARAAPGELPGIIVAIREALDTLKRRMADAGQPWPLDAPRRGIAALRQTHTYVTLEVTGALYDEVAEKLKAAGYDHAFHRQGDNSVLIDMHGIALGRADEPADMDPPARDLRPDHAYGRCPECGRDGKAAGMSTGTSGGRFYCLGESGSAVHATWTEPARVEDAEP